MVNNNDRSASAQMKKNNRAEEWLKNAVKDKHVRQIPFSEITKVKYNVAKGGSGTIHLGAWRNMHVAIKEQHNTNDLIKEVSWKQQKSFIPTSRSYCNGIFSFPVLGYGRGQMDRRKQ